MKSTFNLIRRFIKILLLSTAALFMINVLLLLIITARGVSNAGGWNAARQIGEELTQSENGGYLFSEAGEQILQQRDAWAILIDDKTGDVVWHSDNLPEGVPLHYSVADISYYTRGYIEDYPTTTAARGDDLVILGHPKDMYWKHMQPTFDYDMIAQAPKTVLLFLAVNLLVILLIYFISTSGILRSVGPIVSSIEGLAEGEETYVKEKGLLSDLAAAINRVSEKLMRQKRDLKRRDSARANWISGVSHDIRTPLSMVMGYAGQLENSPDLSADDRKKAGIIRRQSIRMKNLINDLNLASKLEYHMQPISPQPVNLVAAARQSVVDYINSNLDEKYKIQWNTSEELDACMISGDRELLLRAVNNLINNAQTHNPDGCHIFVEVQSDGNEYCILVEDDGVGITDEQLSKLRNTPHYMMSDNGTTEPRHGLGLLIVQQIAAVHKGSVIFDHGPKGGIAVKLTFPISIGAMA